MTATAAPPTATDEKGTRAKAIARLNREYALILLGERPVVLRDGRDPDGASEVRLLSVGGFHEWTRPLYFYANGRKVQASKAWLDSADRRQYDGIVFDPAEQSPASYYNLWRGFAVQPDPAGSCARFLDHVAENICRGDERLFAWVMAWFAQMVQAPCDKPGTALVLRGGQGTGKSLVGEAIGRLLGPHYSRVANSRYVVGRFNSHLANCLLLQLDEATWGGDHAAAGHLKDLITSDWQYIEYKGKEPVKVRNYVRLFITGNNGWLVPAGVDERRFAVLDVGEGQQQNNAYFEAILTELADGGRAALLHYLLTYDLADVPYRTIPRTLALSEQKVASLAPEQQWWLDILQRGTLPGDVEGKAEIEVSALYRHYLERMKELGVSRRLSETAFGMQLHRLVPGMLKQRRTIATPAGTSRPYVYAFPALAECRAAFDRLTGEGEIDGEAPDVWQHDRAPAPAPSTGGFL